MKVINNLIDNQTYFYESTKLSKMVDKNLNKTENLHENKSNETNMNFTPNPTIEEINKVVENYFFIIFPEYINCKKLKKSNMTSMFANEAEQLYQVLGDQVKKAFLITKKYDEMETIILHNQIKEIIIALIAELPNIKNELKSDIQAAFDGDPAAVTFHEIVLSYPFVKTIAIHKISHFLYQKGVPVIPRMLSEWAHAQTGIDIHPGAEIGEKFFIDHGTGVVIGETAQIGNNVKIYQGVTIGALSFEKNTDGSIIKGKKRHPTLCDNVVVYANATILGGETVIGKNSVIGGNTWITKSVKENTIVTITEPDMVYRTKKC